MIKGKFGVPRPFADAQIAVVIKFAGLADIPNVSFPEEVEQRMEDEVGRNYDGEVRVSFAPAERRMTVMFAGDDPSVDAVNEVVPTVEMVGDEIGGGAPIRETAVIPR